jgi:hypothetical protein
VEGIISRGSGEVTVLELEIGTDTGNGKMGGGKEKSQSSSTKALSKGEILIGSTLGGGGVESAREERVVEEQDVEETAGTGKAETSSLRFFCKLRNILIYNKLYFVKS